MIQNAKQKPAVMYGLHFCPGVAEYQEPGKDPYRIFLNEQTLRSMDKTFAGCPVYVQHVEEVNLQKLQEQADGYVVESFYNEADGKHWVKFIVVSDKGHQAIQNGWKLSNAYIPEAFGPGGVWNGVEYQREITQGKFEHLALVNDPRYAESIVLTPAQFQSYNDSLNLELSRVANSKSEAKKESKMSKMFSMFKKTPVADETFEDSIISLPNGKDVPLSELVKNAIAQNAASNPIEEHAEHKAGEGEKGEEEQEKQGHKEEEKGAAPQMANMDHHVMVGNESMPLHEVMKHHEHMRNMYDALSMHHAKMNLAGSEMDGGEKDEAKAGAAQAADETKRNADEDGGEKEAGRQLKESDKTKRNSKENENFKKLAEAPERVMNEYPDVDQFDQLERGQKRYGSKG